MASILANGRCSQAFSATHGDFSNIPPNFCTKAGLSMAFIAAMSMSCADTGADRLTKMVTTAPTRAAFFSNFIFSPLRTPDRAGADDLAAAVGRVGPWRSQQRHMIMRGRVRY